MPSNAQFLIFSFFLPCSVEKMKLIDKEYENFNYSGDRWFSLQSKLAAYRKDIETQMEAEVNTKVIIQYCILLMISPLWHQ